MPSVTSDGSVITTLGDKNDRLGASCDAQAIVKVYSRWEYVNFHVVSTRFEIASVFQCFI